MRLIREGTWARIVATQDRHPPDHISFATVHGRDPFTKIDVAHPYLPNATLTQDLWPVHCVRGTHGAELEPRIAEALQAAEKDTQVDYLFKGEDARVDSYSAFSSNGYASFTPLARLLFSGADPVEAVVVVGVATDYCVLSTALDAAKFGLNPTLIASCMAGVADDTTDAALASMRAYGCRIVSTSERFYS